MGLYRTLQDHTYTRHMLIERLFLAVKGLAKREKLACDNFQPHKE